MRLGNKKAFVTGASRGIGKAIPMAYANAGADVAVTARRTELQEETTREIESRGRHACTLAWYLRDVSQVDDRLADVRESLGGLGIVANNAGVLRGNEENPVPDPESFWDYIMDINPKAVYFVSQGATKLMKEQESSIIINLASDAGMRAAASP